MFRTCRRPRVLAAGDRHFLSGVYVQGNFHVKRVPVIGIMGVTRMRRKLKEGNHCIRSSFVEEYRENFSDTQLFLRTCHQIILRKHDSERAFFAGIRILCV